jgi:CDK inhibitor PHO81
MLPRLLLRNILHTSIECISILSELGADFNYADDINLRSVLHEAAICGRLEIVKLCIQNGSVIDKVDFYGRSPLHYAAMVYHMLNI